MSRSPVESGFGLAPFHRALAFSSAVLLAFGAAALASRDAHGARLFTPPFFSCATADRPECASIGDLNGDGHPDLAIGTDSNHLVSVLLGNGDGTFRPATNFATGGRGDVRAIAIGDLDGDGHPDLVASDLGGSAIAVLRGAGDGTFAASGVFATAGDPLSLVLRDLNGDGKLDVATANVNIPPGSVTVLFGNGDGTFGARTDIDMGAEPWALVTGDFNADGLPDLATANNDSSLAVLLGNGDGTFERLPDFKTGFRPRSLAIGDLNGDGRSDLATSSDGPDQRIVFVVLARTDGTLFRPTSYPTPSFGSDVEIGDVNGDGKRDLLMGAGVVSVMLGNGAGFFGPRLDFPSAASVSRLALGDLDQDGILDVATVNGLADTVTPMLSRGDGTFAVAPTFPAGTSPNAMVAADLNGDGNLDLAVANDFYFDGTMSVLLGNGAGAFGTPTSVVTGHSPRSLAIGDLDGDGKLDAAVANALSNTVSVLLGHGDGTFGLKTDYATSGYPISMGIGDLNRDGKPDLAIVNYLAIPGNYSQSTVSVMLGGGDGTFGPKMDFGTLGQPWSVAIGDVNGDGSPDLAVGYYEYDWVSLLLGNGDGTFAVHADYQVAWQPRFVTLSDVNEDGRRDLIAVCWDGPSISVRLGNADGTLGARADFEVGANPVSAAIGDLDGDGKADVVTANPGGNTLSVLLGNGDGTFGSRTDYGTAIYPSSVVIGDWNRDGWLDVAAACYQSNGVAELLNISGEPVGVPSPSNPAALGGAYLRGLRPNPSEAYGSVVFSLPDGGPARLELFDVGGRRVMEQAVGSLGPGLHVVPLSGEARLAPGVYLIRLTHGGRASTARGVIIR